MWSRGWFPGIFYFLMQHFPMFRVSIVAYPKCVDDIVWLRGTSGCCVYLCRAASFFCSIIKKGASLLRWHPIIIHTATLFRKRYVVESSQPTLQMLLVLWTLFGKVTVELLPALPDVLEKQPGIVCIQSCQCIRAYDTVSL